MDQWLEVTLSSLQRGLESIILFLPKLIGALIVFFVGLLISNLIGNWVSRILKSLRVDRAFERTGWKDALERSGIKISISSFLGSVVLKWILVLLFLMAAIETLGFVQFSIFLGKIVAWLPNLVVSIGIFIAAVVVAEILEKLIKATAKKMGVSLAGVLASIVKGSIYIFSGFAILLQLGVAQEIVKAVVYGIVFTVSLALGLAFGLGGKETAARWLEELEKKISEK